LGFVYLGDFINATWGVYELRKVFVLKDKVYREEDWYAYGVPWGENSISIHGTSLNVSIDYQSNKFRALAEVNTFINKDFISMQLQSELSYHFTRSIKLAVQTEMSWDKYEDSSFIYKTEVLLGIGFQKVR